MKWEKGFNFSFLSFQFLSSHSIIWHFSFIYQLLNIPEDREAELGDADLSN